MGGYGAAAAAAAAGAIPLAGWVIDCAVVGVDDGE